MTSKARIYGSALRKIVTPSRGVVPPWWKLVEIARKALKDGRKRRGS